MSVRTNRLGSYDVRYRDATGRHRSKTFRRKRDAERFDQQVKDAKQTGTLARLDGGQVTLDEYVETTWAPVHAAALAPKTRELYTGLTTATCRRRSATTRCANSPPKSSAAGRPTGSPPVRRSNRRGRR
jgi:hypothetical protein